MKTQPTDNIYGQIKWLIFCILLCSIIFHWRAFTSISIGLLVVLNLITFKKSVGPLRTLPETLFIVSLIALFLISFRSLGYSENQIQAWNNIRTQSGLVLVPFAIFPLISEPGFRNSYLPKIYISILTSTCIYLTVSALLRFQYTGDSAEFFYHQLASPLNHHAIYFSFLVLFGLVILFESILAGHFFIQKSLHFILTFFLTVFVFLLSSKLVLILLTIYLIWLFLKSFNGYHFNKRSVLACSLVILIPGILIFTTKNPVSARFYELSTSNVQMIKQEHFTKADYFNGLQFRLLQWRLVENILTKEGAWLSGVGIGDAQDKLDQQYMYLGMYTGDQTKGTRGYLIYNTHNQFLQSVLQTGIPGLLAIVVMSISFCRMFLKKGNRGLSFIAVSLLSWMFTESVFETQYGIIIFLVFPVMFKITGLAFSEQPASIYKSKMLNTHG